MPVASKNDSKIQQQVGSFNYIGSKGNKHWDGFYCLSGMSQSTMTLLVRFGENKASSPYLTMQSFLFFVPPPLPVRTEKTGFVGGTGGCVIVSDLHISENRAETEEVPQQLGLQQMFSRQLCLMKM